MNHRDVTSPDGLDGRPRGQDRDAFPFGPRQSFPIAPRRPGEQVTLPEQVREFVRLPPRHEDAIRQVVQIRLEHTFRAVRVQPPGVQFVVEDVPDGDEVPGSGPVLGLYVGTPLPQRTAAWSGAQPDRIVLFRRPIETRARSGADLADLVREVVLHEVGHYFGFDDERLDELGW